MLCPRRSESPPLPDPQFEDVWRSNDTCSWCGSLKPEKFFEAVTAGEMMGPTDKSYKLYVGSDHRRKLYFQHFSEEDKAKFIDLVNSKSIKFGFPGHLYIMPYFCTPA